MMIEREIQENNSYMESCEVILENFPAETVVLSHYLHSFTMFTIPRN